MFHFLLRSWQRFGYADTNPVSAEFDDNSLLLLADHVNVFKFRPLEKAHLDVVTFLTAD